MEQPVGADNINVFGITLSPPPSKNTLDGELLRLWFSRIYNVFYLFSKRWVIYPETDDTGRLHFHGYFVVSDKARYKKHINTLRKYGFIKLEVKFKHFLNWQEYCRKSVEETLQIFGTDNIKYIPYTQDTIKLYAQEFKNKYVETQQPILNWIIEEPI